MKRFAVLRARMVEKDVYQDRLAELIHRSRASVSRRLNGHEDWLQSEQYMIMDELRIPYDQMHIVFPKGGISKPDPPSHTGLR